MVTGTHMDTVKGTFRHVTISSICNYEAYTDRIHQDIITFESDTTAPKPIRMVWLNIRPWDGNQFRDMIDTNNFSFLSYL
jgi:hypothetical protein